MPEGDRLPVQHFNFTVRLFELPRSLRNLGTTPFSCIPVPFFLAALNASLGLGTTPVSPAYLRLLGSSRELSGLHSSAVL
jgi:hypothetical protein